MATSRLLMLACLFVSAAAWSRETASPAVCQAAAAKPPIADAKAAVDRDPGNLQANFKLADAWSDAGCFNDALQVLQSAQTSHSGNQELETRLRVARSLIGEEHFFEDLDRANDEAKFKRDIFRCSSLFDLEACNDAVRLRSDDPAVLIAQGDALVHEKRPADALIRYRRAAAVAPTQELAAKINAAAAQLPAAQPGGTLAGTGTGAAPSADASRAAATGTQNKPQKSAPDVRVASADAAPARRYSNAAPEARSH